MRFRDHKYYAKKFNALISKADVSYAPPDGWKSPERGRFLSADGQAHIAIHISRLNQMQFSMAEQFYKLNKKVLSEEEIAILGVPCHAFMYEEIDVYGRLIKGKIYSFLKGDHGAHIIYTALGDAFEKHYPEFEKSLYSLNVIN